MSTTLPHVKEDLEAAELEVRAAQEALISALTSRAVKTTDLGALEAALDAATRKRDDLLGTRDFIIERERQRGLASTGHFSSVLYISSRAPGFTFEDIAVMADAAQQKNESIGVTGCLYVFGEWLASYLEGSERDLTKLMRSISADPRHTNLRILRRDLPETATKRLFPKDGLTVRWIVDGPSPQSTELWKVLIPYLQTQLHFFSFEPKATVAARGVGHLSGRWYIVHIGPSPRFDEYLQRVLDQGLEAKSIEASYTNVRRAARQVIEQLSGASMLTPLCTNMIAVIPADIPAASVVAEMMNVRQKIYDAEPAFYPHIACLLTSDSLEAQVISDGNVTVCGPAMRRARKLWTVAVQEDRPVVLDSLAAAELDDRSICVSQGWFDFDGVAAEVFVPAALSGDSPLATWGTLIDHQLRSKTKAAQKKRLSFAASSSGLRASSWANSSAPSSQAGTIVDEDRVLPVVDPASVVTADTFARSLVGGITEDQLRREFDRCGPREADNTISVTQLQKALYDIDYMGHPPSISEIFVQLRNLGAMPVEPTPTDSTDDPPPPSEGRISFDQFAVMWCRALLR